MELQDLTYAVPIERTTKSLIDGDQECELENGQCQHIVPFKSRADW